MRTDEGIRHRRRPGPGAFIGLTAGLLSLLACVPAEAGCSTSRDAAAVAAALRLVPDGRRLTIRTVDPDVTGDPAAVRQLDAFVVRERDGALRQVVYLNCRSPMFEAAARGSDFYIKVLAAVILHEQCHLEGLDERAAAAAERSFFAALVRDGLVPAAEGLAHLKLMEQKLHTR
jgi:hypothetical protein